MGSSKAKKVLFPQSILEPNYKNHTDITNDMGMQHG
jgi:hypothetical protein